MTVTNLTTIPAHKAEYKPQFIAASSVAPAGPNSADNPLSARELVERMLNRKLSLAVPFELWVAAAQAKHRYHGNPAQAQQLQQSIHNVMGSTLLALRDEAAPGSLMLAVIEERLTKHDNPIPNYVPTIPPPPPGGWNIAQMTGSIGTDYSDFLAHKMAARQALVNRTPIIQDEDVALTLAQALREAVDEYVKKTLMGLNAMTEEDIQEKIEEFKAFFMPQDGSPEEMAQFLQKLGEFERMLRDLAANGHRESLLNIGGGSDDDDAAAQHAPAAMLLNAIAKYGQNSIVR